MDVLTPAQTTELISRIGTKKAHMRTDRLFINAVLGAMLLGFGCVLKLSTSASPWFQEHAPGLIRTTSALIFYFAIIMIFITGTDLFTTYVLVYLSCDLLLCVSLHHILESEN